MGDECRKHADFVGAIVEYGEALKIKDSVAGREKLEAVSRVGADNSKNAVEKN